MAKKKKEDHIKRDGFTCCSTGGKNHANYANHIYSVNIRFESKEDHGEFLGWELYDCEGVVDVGKDRESFINKLHAIAKQFNLEKYNEYSKDKILIYIDNVEKIDGFFNKYKTDYFSYLTLDLEEFFEFRSYEIFEPEIKTAAEAVIYMQILVNRVFVPEKHFYITPNQHIRQVLKDLCKKSKSTIAKEMFPDNPFAYNRLREALYGGICYCPIPGVIKDVPMLGLDIKSAYIYGLLTQKYPMSKAEKTDPSTWEFYINNSVESSLGIYKIKYTTSSNIVHCFKEYKGDNVENLVTGEDIEVYLTLNSIDLSILLNLPKVYIKEVTCYYLEIYKMDYLPDYVIDTLIAEYIKKNHIDKEKNAAEYALQKTILNGIYGNMIKKLRPGFFKSQRDKSFLAPQWGIWTTSYCKKHLLGLALQVEGWLYSDTDSIYCYDTIENRKILDKYNLQTLSVMKEFCERYGADFFELCDLGSFEIEHNIIKFKAIQQKEYLFTELKKNKKTGKIEKVLQVKAAGCNKEEMPMTDRLYKCKHLPVGSRTFTFPLKDSYFEKTLVGEAAREMLVLIANIEEDDNYDTEF